MLISDARERQAEVVEPSAVRRQGPILTHNGAPPL
jgi:hypothetical protein